MARALLTTVGMASSEPDGWTPDQAERAAAALHIALKPLHWRAIGCARELYAARGAAPNLGTLAHLTGLEERRIAELFPDPTRSLGRIAGVGDLSAGPGSRSSGGRRGR